MSHPKEIRLEMQSEPVEPDQSSPGVSIDDPLLAHAVER